MILNSVLLLEITVCKHNIKFILPYKKATTSNNRLHILHKQLNKRSMIRCIYSIQINCKKLTNKYLTAVYPFE